MLSVAVTGAAISGTTQAGATSVTYDQAQIAQIEQRILAQGVAIQAIVSRYDATQAVLNALQVRLRAAQVKLAAEQRAEAQAAAHLRQIALYAYESGGGLSSVLSMFATSDVNTVLVRTEYIKVAGGNVKTAIDTYSHDQRATEATAAILHSEQSRTQATLVQLASQRQAAQVAMASEQATLSQVKGNLATILAALAAQRAARARAAELALARQQAIQAAAAAAARQAAQQSAPPPPPPPSVHPAPGAYVNPLRAVSGLNPERIDQGVDFSGYGPIYAIGDGVVLNTVNSGWPGGTFITYRLTDGPASGLVVYAAEDIYPTVQVGQSVTPNTVLGTMYEGPDGIETGWASRSGTGYTMAREYGQFSGSNSTAFGYNFSQLLQYVGAPGGILQNNPPTGNLPPGWPTW